MSCGAIVRGNSADLCEFSIMLSCRWKKTVWSEIGSLLNESACVLSVTFLSLHNRHSCSENEPVNIER